MSKAPIVDRVVSVKGGLITALVGAALGLVASFMLSIDAVTLANNSHAVLTCNVSLVLNCATVAKDAAAHVFGFPNSFIGIAALSALATIVVTALAGVALPRWFRRALALGVVAGLVFAGWMFFQSYVVIQVLCPWCLTTDLGMILIAFGVFRYLARGYDDTFGSWSQALRRFSVAGYDLMVAVAVIVLIVVSILVKFGWPF